MPSVQLPPLTLKMYNAGPGSFHVNSVVITGKSESLAIDSGFARSDALRIAANILDAGKPISRVFISNADPDYYFGAEVLRGLFPEVRTLTSPAVREKIQEKLAAKLAFWSPKMGANAPRRPIVPDAFAGAALELEGRAIELRGSTGLLAHRPYLWIPSLRAIVGNVAVFGNLHVWTADVQKLEERQAWLDQLDEMLALNPAVVVPGHMAEGTALDATAIVYTRDYLRRFYAEAAKAPNAAELVKVMRLACPRAGLPMALEIGAKVAKNEMQW